MGPIISGAVGAAIVLFGREGVYLAADLMSKASDRLKKWSRSGRKSSVKVDKAKTEDAEVVEADAVSNNGDRIRLHRQD